MIKQQIPYSAVFDSLKIGQLEFDHSLAHSSKVLVAVGRRHLVEELLLLES